MRTLLSRLMTFGLPALLVVAVMAWSGGAQAMDHHEGAAAMHAIPCHDDAAQPMAAGAPASDQGCPDCRCLFAGCNASAALPGLAGSSPVAFTLSPPLPVIPARLVSQALTGPPTEPPRL